MRGPAVSGEKVIGVLGGMGPEATLSFYEKLIANTPAARDQDHLRVVIDSNPKVPDRTAALLGLGGSPLPMMVAGMEALARAGADFVVIPCVSAHGFLDDLRRQARLPLLSALDAVADHLQRDHPSVKKVGLLATSGTLDSGGFQATLARAGVQAIAPEAADQARVMSAIYAIKRSASGNRVEIREELRRVAEGLVALGAQGIVLGCTEIPIVLTGEGLGVPVFDVVRILARASISAAGRVPLVEEA